MSKKLLIDTIPFIVEQKKIVKQNIQTNSQSLILTGVIQRANTKNHNGRIYTKELLQRQMQKLKSKMEMRSLFGQLDHPQTFTVSLKHACILILDYWWVNDDMYGKVQVLSNALGQSLKRLIIKDKAIVGISSRGAGSTRVTEQGQIVQDDFQMITFDIVSQPSTIGAYMYAKNQSRQFNQNINELINKIIVNI